MDDWTLEGLSFDSIALQFKGNGLYYGGLAHLHYFINMVDGESVWFSRLLSLICLLNAPILLFFILVQLFFDESEAFQISTLAIAIPLFGSAFGEIVLPYLICLNLFLSAVSLIAKFLTAQKDQYLLLMAASPLLFASFVTNSFIFYSLPVVLIISAHQWLKTNRTKRALTVASLLVVLVGSFFVFKSIYLAPQAGSPYAIASYNSFSLADLLFNGPVKAVKYLVSYPVVFAKEALEIFANQFNFLLFLGMSILGIIFLATRKNQSFSSRPQRDIFAILAIGFLLLAAAVYPYAVVGKLSDSLFSYNERHNLLISMGAAILLFSLLRLMLRTYWMKYAYVIIVLFFLIIKLNVLGYFSIKANIQQATADKLGTYIREHQLSNQSVLFIDTLHDDQSLNDWSFYEYGGMIRSLNLPENKVFVSESLVRKNRSGKSQLNIKGNTIMFIKNSNYGISQFDTTQYEVKYYDVTLGATTNGYLWHSLYELPTVKIFILD